jgi:hypothetical protein
MIRCGRDQKQLLGRLERIALHRTVGKPGKLQKSTITLITKGLESGAPRKSVVCLLGSANRDPAVYPDPERLDIMRQDVRPLSFGVHYCVGANWPRIEGEIAIATLPRRSSGAPRI